MRTGPLRAASEAPEARPDATVPPRVAEAVEVLIKYAGYLQRQEREMAAFRSGGDALPLPDDMCYSKLQGLSREEAELLEAARPTTVHAASRVPGVRPSTHMLLFQVAKRVAATATAGQRGL